MADALALCLECHTAPRRNDHGNTKYCEPCRQALLRAPPSRITAAQGALIAALRGTLTRWQIAERVGISHARVNRYLAEQHLTSNARDYPPEVVEAVSATYGGLGKRQTQALFPDVVVRSIVERRQHHRVVYQPRQVRWTGEQIVEAIRMAGLVSHHTQVRYFGRPNAFDDSIKKLWERVIGVAPRDVHGFGLHQVWRLARPGTPAVLVTQATQPGPRAVILWLDLAQHLRLTVAPEVRQMVEALARFQAWLFGSTDTAVIRRMITEREAYARDDPGEPERTPDTRRGLRHADGPL